MSENATQKHTSRETDLPDTENPALIDARQAFIITVVSATLFIGVVAVFVLF